MPITWKNVDGPSLEGVSKILDSAGTTMNAGFDKLNQVIKTREDTQASNWEAEKANNTRAAIDKLMSTKTPAELEAMKASGELDQFAARFGDQFDQAKMREAVTGQMKSLRGEQVDSYNHNKTMTAQRSEPIFELYKQAGLNRDQAAQAKLVADNPDLPWADMVSADQELERKQWKDDAQDKINPLLWNNQYYEAEDKGAEMERQRGLAPLKHGIEATSLKEQADTQRVTHQTKMLEREASMAVQAHRTTQHRLGKELGDIGKANGLPVDGQGRLDLDLLDDKQQEFMKKTAPDMFKAYAAGDTAAADSFMKSVGSRYDAELVERTRDALRPMFDSNRAETLVGRDADNVLKGAIKQEVYDEELAGSNPYIPGSKQALAMYDKLKPMIPDMIDRTTGIYTDEDIPAMSSFLYEMVSEGIEVDVGGEKVTPSEMDLREVIGAADGGIFRDKKRAENAKDLLRKIMRKNGTKEKLAEASEARVRERTREFQRKLKEARNPSPPAKTK
jgi:hypothetical protein